MKSLSAFIFCFSIAVFISGGCHNHHSHEDNDNENESHFHNDGFTIKPEQAKNFGIEYEIVAPSAFHEVIKTGGAIEPAPSDLYTLTAKKSGIVTLEPGINRGAEVNAGARIASISSNGMEGGDVARAAVVNLQAAKAEYERLKPLFEDGLVTKSALQEAERAYKEAAALAGNNTPAGTVSVTSPMQGTITELLINSGEYVEAGSPVAVVSKNSRLTLRADLPSRYSSRIPTIKSANFLPEGASEIVRLDDLGGSMASGNYMAESNNGYIPVYFTFTGNPVSHPGGFAEVFLLGAERNDVVSVPRSALLEIQGNKYVYVVHDNDRYEKKIVATGASDGNRIEIKSGLEKGEKIVSKGASVVRMAENSAVAPPSHSHNH